jgi:hypothetical protein
MQVVHKRRDLARLPSRRRKLCDELTVSVARLLQR